MRAFRLSPQFLLVLLAACSNDDETTMTSDDALLTEATPSQADLVARGEYLVSNVGGCSDCHTPRGPMGMPIQSQYLAGAECFIRLENGGCLNTSNLTNHTTGLMSRTDAEIRRMLVDGVRPTANGDELLYPIMASFVLHNMRDQDIDAIIAYLRTVPGVEHTVPRRAPEFDPLAPANPLDVDAIPQPPADYEQRESALRGRYLAAEAGACIICHTPRDLQSPDILDYTRFFTGNEQFDVGLPEVSVARNITPDVATGLADWTPQDIVNVIKQGKDKSGAGICPPMLGLFAGLTDADALDIAHYIKSLPAAPGLVEDSCVFSPM